MVTINNSVLKAEAKQETLGVYFKHAKQFPKAKHFNSGESWTPKELCFFLSIEEEDFTL